MTTAMITICFLLAAGTLFGAFAFILPVSPNKLSLVALCPFIGVLLTFTV